MESNKGAIILSNLTVKYNLFTAVNKVSFIVQKGEIFGLLGPNGSGKTSIIKVLCGLVVPHSGRGSILGYDIYQDIEVIRQRVGYMSQSFSLYEDLTVSENMDFYGRIYGLDRAYLRRRKEEVIALMKLNPYVNRRSGNLSGGWKQRLALGCAIIHEPDVVFLDEPTAGIDPVARREIWDLLFKLSGQGMTFLVTTHYMDEAERCGRIGYIYLSKLIAFGLPEELKVLPEVSPKGTTRLEIVSKSPFSTLEFTSKLPYVLDATIFGHSIHALLKSDNSIERLKKDLDRAGFGRVSIQTISPTLEDVFVSLTKHVANQSNNPRN